MANERKEFYSAVYATVRLVPTGKVTSYGHIARLIQCPQNSRRVGKALKELYSPEDAEVNGEIYNHDNVPWQRIVNHSGNISPRSYGSAQQAQKLIEEGVEVDLVRAKVNLKQYGWFPNNI